MIHSKLLLLHYLGTKIPLIAAICLLLQFQGMSESCKKGKKPLFYAYDTSVVMYTGPAFANNFFQQLESLLPDIGYCLEKFESSTVTDTSHFNDLVMFCTANSFKDTSGVDSTVTMWIGLFRAGELAGIDKIVKTIENPLISLSFDPGELITLESVLVKKIIENLRMQYVCQLRVQSNPNGVTVKTSMGLEGVTPLEWVLPLGDLTINGSLKDYESVKQSLDLNNPGIYTYVLQMRKHQFYTSKFMYPTVVGALAAVGFLGIEKYYLKKYSDLGKKDYNENPELFGLAFKKAQYSGRAAIGSLILCGASLVLTFVF
jgi:hypothetical protein